jgi:uncharacterized protein YukE
MSTAHANLEDLRRLQRSVKGTQERIDQAMKSLQKDLNRADWQDAARRDFESKLNEAASALRQTNNRLGELSPILSRKITQLSTYLGR